MVGFPKSGHIYSLCMAVTKNGRCVIIHLVAIIVTYPIYIYTYTLKFPMASLKWPDLFFDVGIFPTPHQKMS